MAKPAKWHYTRRSAIPSVVQHVHQLPATSSCHQQFHPPTTYMCLTTQQKMFEHVEITLDSGLIEVGTYYNETQLRPNPAKTQLTAFHLKNHQADRKLNITWNGTKLCLKTRAKLSSRNNLLRGCIVRTEARAPTP